MSHKTEARIYTIVVILGVCGALYFIYTKLGLGGLWVFAFGYTFKDFYCQIREYANKPRK